MKADDSIAAGTATTDSRADSDNESSSAGISADKEKSPKKQKIIKNLLHQLQL